MTTEERAQKMEELVIDASDLASVANGFKTLASIVRDIFIDINKTTDVIVSEDSWNGLAKDKFKEIYDNDKEFFNYEIETVEGLSPILGQSASEYQDVTDSNVSGVLGG